MQHFTPKQRLISTIRNEEVDRVPFSPFLAYYFDKLPEDVRAKGQLAYLEEMGADPLLRGFSQAFKGETPNVTTTKKVVGNKRYETIQTAKGDLQLVYTFVEDANTWFLTEHPVKDEDDLVIFKEYLKNVKITDNRQAVNDAVKEIGERGLLVPVVGNHMIKSGFQSLLEHWVGTENLIYLVQDEPETIDEILEDLHKLSAEAIKYTADTNIEFCISWEDSSTTNVSPSMYEQYIAPEISSWCKTLKEHNIGYIQHACGTIKNLLVPMSKQGITAVESITPPFTGDVTMQEAVNLLPTDVSIIGGIDPVFLINSSIEELEEYVRSIVPLMKNRGFVLANSDSCPPNVEYEKFLHLAKLVKSL